MTEIQQQEAILIAIGKALTKKIEIYAIGGTAMMLQGIKNATLDIDLVFDKKSDREKFANTLKKLGAKESDTTLVYGFKKNTPLMLKFDNCRFDLFMSKIISSTFSDSMKERANQIHEFDKLKIKTANLNDILIMKSATSREKDLEDIISIFNKGKIDWNILLKESEKQVELGNITAIMNLGEKLETLNNNKLIRVPKEILDKIWRLFKKQIKDKQLSN